MSASCPRRPRSGLVPSCTRKKWPRSTRSIALASSGPIRWTSDRAANKKPLSAHKAKDGNSRVTVKRLGDFEGEKLWIARRLGELPKDERPHCVILARRKKLLEDMVSTLTSKSIPAYIAIKKN